MRVEGDRITRTESRLLRPPRREFVFTHIHGIEWEHVQQERPFGEVWPELAPLFEGVDFVAAHNASVDRGVLDACCAAAGLAAPTARSVCTVERARRAWVLPSARLNVVCEHLGIPLKHHDAASDAQACARIILRAREEGHAVD